MRRRRRLRKPGSILLVALLLVPLLVSGHHHAAHASAPCAACAVTQHTPVVSAPAFRVPTAVPIVVGIEPMAASAPAAPRVRQPTGRGPPARALSQAT